MGSVTETSGSQSHRDGKGEAKEEKRPTLLHLQDLQIYVCVCGGALAPLTASYRPRQVLSPLGGAPVNEVHTAGSTHCLSLDKWVAL